MGQDYAQKEVCHRVHLPSAQGQGQPRTLQTQVCQQFPDEPHCGAWGLLLL